MALEISKKECENIISKLFEHRPVVPKVINFKIFPLPEKSIGFFGIHSQLKIELDTGTKAERIPDSMVLFVKAMPQSAIHQKYLEEIGAFQKETDSFRTLLPSMLELSKKHGKRWAPECYLVRSDLLVLENLYDSGFRNLNDSLFDHSHLVAVAESLGYFHASSVAFERRCLRTDAEFGMLDSFGGCLFESLYVQDERNVRHRWFHSGVAIVLRMARLMNKYSDRQIAQVEARIPLLLEGVKRNFEADGTKTNVVCHGDLWTNNLMFKYEGRAPVECRMVDFQLVRYAPNTLDLTCMLHLCADRRTRERNLRDVLKAYLHAFNSHLIVYGLEDRRMDLSRVLLEYEGFRVSALVEACLYEMVTRLGEERSAALLASPAEAERLFYGDRERLVLPTFASDARYRARMVELIEELIDTYVLV